MNQQLKERLETTMEKFSISQNAAAKEIGYSGAVLSAYRAGTYNGDVAKLEEATIITDKKEVNKNIIKHTNIISTY